MLESVAHAGSVRLAGRRSSPLGIATATATMIVALAVTPLALMPRAARAAETSAPAAARNLVLLHENSLRGVSVINIARGVREHVLHVLDEDWARSPDGWRVAYPCESADFGDGAAASAVCVRRIDGSAPPVVIRPPSALRPATPWNVQWSPDGRRLAVVWTDARKVWNISGELWTVRADGREARRLTPTVEAGEPPAWSPDGSRLAYSAGPRSGIYVVRADGTRLRRVSAGPRSFAISPLWSRAGSLIAYVQRAPGTHDDGVYVVRPDGSHRRQLLGAGALARLGTDIPGLGWSSDGRWLAAQGGRTAVVDIRTGHRQYEAGRRRVGFAPVGDRIALQQFEPRFRLTVVRPGRRGKEHVADGVYDFSWSYDGRRIVYCTQTGMWVADLTTSATRAVVAWDLPPGNLKGPVVWAERVPPAV